MNFQNQTKWQTYFASLLLISVFFIFCLLLEAKVSVAKEGEAPSGTWISTQNDSQFLISLKKPEQEEGNTEGISSPPFIPKAVEVDIHNVHIISHGEKIWNIESDPIKLGENAPQKKIQVFSLEKETNTSGIFFHFFKKSIMNHIFLSIWSIFSL
jgi:hypothetical protein